MVYTLSTYKENGKVKLNNGGTVPKDDLTRKQIIVLFASGIVIAMFVIPILILILSAFGL